MNKYRPARLSADAFPVLFVGSGFKYFPLRRLKSKIIICNF